jgi:uncharacterized protein (TIGR02118 family)
MVAIYKTPEDTASFDKHYLEVHVPLAKKLPGLRKYRLSQGSISTPFGASEFHMVATLHFDDMEAIKNAFASPEGRAAAADVQTFRQHLAHMLLIEDHEV